MRKLVLIGSANSVYSEKPAKDSTPNHYPELRRLIKERGLLDKQPAYYASKILLTLVMLILSIILLVIVDNFWLQLVNAAFLAFVFGQIGYVGHDAGHRAVCRSIRGNTIIGLSVSFLIGLSRTWWVTQHNQHHSTPNDLDLDPHTALPLLVFSEDAAARGKRGLMQVCRRIPGLLFRP